MLSSQVPNVVASLKGLCSVPLNTRCPHPISQRLMKHHLFLTSFLLRFMLNDNKFHVSYKQISSSGILVPSWWNFCMVDLCNIPQRNDGNVDSTLQVDCDDFYSNVDACEVIKRSSDQGQLQNCEQDSLHIFVYFVVKPFFWMTKLHQGELIECSQPREWGIQMSYIFPVHVVVMSLLAVQILASLTTCHHYVFSLSMAPSLTSVFWLVLKDWRIVKQRVVCDMYSWLWDNLCCITECNL